MPKRDLPAVLINAAMTGAIGLVVPLAAQPPLNHSAFFTAPASTSTSDRDRSWSDVTAGFLAAVLDSAAADEPAILPNVVITKFNQVQREDLETLRLAVCGMKPIALRQYSGTPLTMASDISADVKDANIPATLKRRLTPSDDEDAMKRANAVAAKWVATALAVKGNEPIACIVLWQPVIPATKPSMTTAPEKIKLSEAEQQQASGVNSSPLFILLRGEMVDGHIRIVQIAYGNPVGMGEESPPAKGF